MYTITNQQFGAMVGLLVARNTKRETKTLPKTFLKLN